MRFLFLYVLLGAGIFFSPSVSFSQAVAADPARAAAANVGMLMDSKLSGMVAVMNKVLACNSQKMLYAPNTSGADANGCVSVADTSLVSRVANLESFRSFYEGKLWSMYVCGANGYTYDGGSNCRKTIAHNSPNFDNIARIDGGWGPGGGSRTVYCPAGMIRVGCGYAFNSGDGRSVMPATPYNYSIGNGCEFTSVEWEEWWKPIAYCAWPQ